MAGKMDLILEKVNTILVVQGRTEEHLKNLNGHIQRHETLIENNRKGITNAKINIARIIGFGGLGGLGAALIILLISKAFGLG